jgi:FtsZ-interacting cell division protein YlmF
MVGVNPHGKKGRCTRGSRPPKETKFKGEEMRTQHYRVVPKEIEKCKAGQFVFENNNTTEIIGFISSVGKSKISIVLFEPKEISDTIGATNISNKCEWQGILDDIMTKDPTIKQSWMAAMRNS